MTERRTATTAPYTIGTPPFRPGESADFGGSFKEQPEDLNRPDPSTCTSDDTASHARGLVRVLDDNGEAKGEWDPNLDKATMIEGLEYMMRLRIFDDRMIKMQRTGKLSFYMRSFGEEAIAELSGNEQNFEEGMQQTRKTTRNYDKVVGTICKLKKGCCR